ncbi:proline-rich protein 12 [Plakobranchus ocellatus]|uniref:Proline-rich protein 12 n=1 Tax=Plakobranchus ocellatus TaxID=259542 RepID=A0AAV3ZD63_9GAST|nr:proline-rich protein 12 [Plakobranchus ocellatus]
MAFETEDDLISELRNWFDNLDVNFFRDLNQGELIEKRKRPRRQRLSAEAKLSKQGGARGRGGSHGSIDEGPKTAADVSSNTPIKVGTYMIEKKDMENSESYPIWRLEENNQIKKFDLKVVNGNVKHLASETTSTWMPSMANQFQPIKVRETEVRESGIVSTVEVLEEYRPKGQVNSNGVPYDRFLLTEKPGSGNHAQEFMIGKLAAQHVRTYHSLYHFKYWLRQRCDTKVKMTKESNKSENLTDEIVLDKCLENRNWVLQLFDSLKSLLRNGGDASS